LESLDVAFAELADSFSDFHANMQQVVELGQGVSRFNESFASFLYGLSVNAFCVDFPEAPVAESFKRAAERQASSWQPEYKTATNKGGSGADNTFMTTDDSFVERP
ncbi:DASH complex subunit Dam1-domain-containing protein, partial [Protomyces lactucae-debilis]